MSLAEEEENSKWYDGGGIGGTYSIPFRFREASWLRVTIIHADKTSAEIGTTDFTLTGDSALGTAVLKLSNSVAPPSTSQVIISRLAPSTQNLSLSPNAPLPAKDLETALDHLAMAIRDRDSDHKDTASKALLFPVGEPKIHNTRLPLPQQRKGMFIGFDETTGAMEARPLSAALHTAITQALATIASAKTTTLAVLNNALAVGTELLGKIPLFYKAEESGGIKLGQVAGGMTGTYGINLQTHRTDPWQVASGAHSIAIGNAEASGSHSISIGNSCRTTGSYTTSVGYGNEATFHSGSAFGLNNRLLGDSSVALGAGNIAESFATVAVGISSQASGQYSSAFGYQSSAGGSGCSAIGYRNSTDFELASAVGAENLASGSRSSAHGYGNGASNSYSSAFGYSNDATGEYSVAMGAENNAPGNNASAVGNYNSASGHASVAMGRNNSASNNQSVAVGVGNVASGYSSHASGIYNNVAGPESVASGFGNHISQDRSIAFGRYSTVHAYDAGVVGIQAYATASNAIAFGYSTNVGTWGVTELANMSAGYGARVRADSMSGSVALSFGYMMSAPTAAIASAGDEPSGTLANNMLLFRSNGHQLFIDVCVEGTIRTITLSLP